MGVLQALEAVKLISRGMLRADGYEEGKVGEASMLLFSANSNPPFRNVRLRARRGGELRRISWPSVRRAEAEIRGLERRVQISEMR